MNDDAELSVGGRIALVGFDSSRNIAESLRRALVKHQLLAEPLPRLGRYEIRRKIGEGGMAVVFEAWDPELARPLAVKVLHARYADRVIDIQHEARLLARLSDPAIVGVHDIGVHDGQLFLCMTLVAGGDLGRHLPASGPVPWRRIIGWFADAARGLHAAHVIGIIHRDFKLENLLLGTDGRVRVSDFGLARVAEIAPPDSEAEAGESSEATTTPIGPAPVTWTGVVGTPGCIAPEVLAGGPSDPRSDQWAFFRALDRALAYAKDDPPTELAEMIERGLAEQPEQRYADLDEVEAILREALATHAPPRAPALSPATEQPSPRIESAPIALAKLIEIATLTRSRDEFRREAMAWVDRHVGFDTALFGDAAGYGDNAPLILNFDPSFVAQFAAQPERYAPALIGLVGASAVSQAPIRDVDVYAGSARAKIAFYNELIGPKGSKVMSVGALQVGGALCGTLQISRASRGASFLDRELVLLRQALPLLALGERAHMPGPAGPSEPGE